MDRTRRGKGESSDPAEASEAEGAVDRMEAARMRGLLRRKAQAGKPRAEAPATAERSQGLPSPLKSRFESKLGQPLDGVRLHTGKQSEAAAEAADARAFTVGNDIHFNRGELDPDSREGQQLLAHEVAHTLQAPGGPRFQKKSGAGESAEETEADAVASSLTGESGSAPQGNNSPGGQGKSAPNSQSNATPMKQTVPPDLLEGVPALAGAGAVEEDAQLDDLLGQWTVRSVAQALLEERDKEFVAAAANAKPKGEVVDNVLTATADFRAEAGKFRDACKRSAMILATKPGNVELAEQLVTFAEKQMQAASDSADSDMRAAKQQSETFLSGPAGPFMWSAVKKENDPEVVKQWLAVYQFAPKPGSVTNSSVCMLNNQEKQTKEVIELFISEAQKAGFNYSEAVVKDAVADAHSKAEAAQLSGDGEGDGKSGIGQQISVSLQVNLARHTSAHKEDDGKNDANDDNEQVTAAYTLKFHDEKSGGFEMAFQGSFSFVTNKEGKGKDKLSLKNFKPAGAQAQGSIQGAVLTEKFAHEIFQLEGFAQLALGGQKDDFYKEWVVAPQAVAGGQLQIQIKEFSKAITLFVGGQESVTGGPHPTVDAQGFAGIQVAWDL